MSYEMVTVAITRVRTSANRRSVNSENYLLFIVLLTIFIIFIINFYNFFHFVYNFFYIFRIFILMKLKWFQSETLLSPNRKKTTNYQNNHLHFEYSKIFNNWRNHTLENLFKKKIQIETLEKLLNECKFHRFANWWTTLTSHASRRNWWLCSAHRACHLQCQEKVFCVLLLARYESSRFPHHGRGYNKRKLQTSPIN